jgi:hypothetical protein
MTKRTLLGWSPVVVFLVYFGIRSMLEARFPSLLCSPINANGKELVCGFEYSAPAAKTMSVFFGILYFGALAIAGHQALQQKLSKPGAVGLTISVLIVLAGLVLRSHFGSEDSP